MASVGSWEARIGMSGRSTYPFPSSCALQSATFLLRGQASVNLDPGLLEPFATGLREGTQNHRPKVIL
jgi:hypothetical protein